MKIKINEKIFDFQNEVTIFELKKRFKPLADIVVLNGFPIKEDAILKDGDRISLIKRGEVLDKEELKALMIARHTPGTYESLENATVVIIGVGGLGSNIAISLARVGVGNLVLIDFDIVEPSNLNRQQYFMEDLGSFKVDAMKNIIEKINPFINVIVHKCFLDEGNIKEVIGVGDIVIEAVDNPESKALIANSTLVNFRDKYFIGSSGMAGYFSSNTIKTRKINSKFFLCGDEENEAKIGSGLMAPRVAIAANHMANMAVRILCKEFEV